MAVQFVFLFYSFYEMCFPVWWVCLHGGRCARRQQAAGSCWHANYLRTQYWLKVKSGGGGGVVRRAADTRDTQRSPPPRSQQLAGQQPAAGTRGQSTILLFWAGDCCLRGPGRGACVRAGAGRGRPGTGSVRYSGQWSPGTGPGARGTSGQLPDTETRPRLMTRGLATLSPSPLPFIWVLFLLCQAASSIHGIMGTPMPNKFSYLQPRPCIKPLDQICI